MNDSKACTPAISSWRWTLLLALPLAVWGTCLTAGPVLAQQAEPGPGLSGSQQATPDLQERLEEAERSAEARLAEGRSSRQGEAAAAAPPATPEKINLLHLLMRGRWLMLPIALMSLLVVAVGAERLLGLRRGKVLPSKLIAGVGKIAAEPRGFDLRRALKLCQQYPSSAAKVIQAMLLKVGRPVGELEQAVGQANEREAAKLYANVRWLSLAAGITPLLGLLGTVWGMIEAFFQTAYLPIGANKATYLADGIWKALVTTFAGLAVAIPAAILAHFFEGRIQKLLNELEENLIGLLPKLERYEGRVRFRAKEAEPAGRQPASEKKAEQLLGEQPAAPRQ